MSEQQDWVINQLKQLQTDENHVTIEAAISLLEDQQSEIESLRGAMEGKLWSPNQWRK